MKGYRGLQRRQSVVQPMCIGSPNESTTPAAQIQLPALNEYSLLHIFSYLNTVDKILVARSCCYFDEIIDRLISTRLFDYDAVCEYFPIEELPFIFAKYGQKIRKMHINLQNVFHYEYMWGMHKAYEFCYEVDSKLIEMMIKPPKQMRLFPCDHSQLKDDHCYKFRCFRINRGLVSKLFKAPESLKHFRSKRSQLRDAHCLLIANLTELEYLNIKGSHSITGIHLDKLTRLKYLNMQDCTMLEAKHFVEICKATKLKSLNIVKCELLDTHAFETLLETQSELVELHINISYPAGRPDCVTRLEKLKHINIDCWTKTDMPNLSDLKTEFFNLLAKYHHNTLITLFINQYPPRRAFDLKPMLKFKNLLHVGLSSCKYVDDKFLVEMSRNCPQLITVILSGSYKSVTNAGILQLVANLKKLAALDLRRFDAIDDHLLVQINDEIMKQKDRKGVKIYFRRKEEADQNIWPRRFSRPESGHIFGAPIYYTPFDARWMCFN